MAGHEERFELTDIVGEAIAHRRWRGTNDNPALGKAVLYVEKRLLPWVRGQLASDVDDILPDAENLVADVGCEAIVNFGHFSGATGGEFYRWMQEIAAQKIALAKRLREAREKGALRQGMSLERAAEARRLAEMLISPEQTPDEACMIRENAVRVHRAMRCLSVNERRVATLRRNGHSLRDIAATFGHSVAWVQDHWESAAQHLRSALVRRKRRQTNAAAGRARTAETC